MLWKKERQPKLNLNLKIFTLKVFEMMPHDTLKFQIAFWALKPTSSPNLNSLNTFIKETGSRNVKLVGFNKGQKLPKVGSNAIVPQMDTRAQQTKQTNHDWKEGRVKNATTTFSLEKSMTKEAKSRLHATIVLSWVPKPKKIMIKRRWPCYCTFKNMFCVFG